MFNYYLIPYCVPFYQKYMNLLKYYGFWYKKLELYQKIPLFCPLLIISMKPTRSVFGLSNSWALFMSLFNLKKDLNSPFFKNYADKRLENTNYIPWLRPYWIGSTHIIELRLEWTEPSLFMSLLILIKIRTHFMSLLQP